MAQLGSVVGIAVNAFTVSGKKNECSMASAPSNSFCAAGEHEVLKCTRPSFSGLPVRFAGSLSAHTDATKLKDTTSAVRNLTGLLMTPLLIKKRTSAALPDDLALRILAQSWTASESVVSSAIRSGNAERAKRTRLV